MLAAVRRDFPSFSAQKLSDILAWLAADGDISLFRGVWRRV